MTQLKPLIGSTLSDLKQIAQDTGLKPFAASQMARWLYTARITDIDQMTDLSKTARQRLKQAYTIGLKPPLREARSTDGTIKYLFPGTPARAVETVYIPDRDRATLCVSSQAGCRMNCSFCMTGRQGFNGNLTAAQIINQILAIPQSESLTNIVFMGMGEPLDNTPELLKTIEILTSKWGLAWSPKRITVSTIGKIDQLTTLLDRTKVHIAISVHSPHATQRAALMPIEKAYPIAKVFEILRGYDFAHQRRLSAEYIMWRGLNDDIPHAQALARLIRGTSCRVNLIRYHATAGDTLQPPTQQTMERFRDTLNDMGITATIRASRGQDIDAACGMLSGKAQNVNP